MAESARQPGAATSTETAAPGLLEQIITNTKQTQPDRAQDLVKNLVEQALAGTVTFDRNLTRTFDKAVAAIDAKMSAQLNADHARSEIPQAGGQLAGAALPGAEFRDRHLAQAPGLEHQQARAGP